MKTLLFVLATTLFFSVASFAADTTVFGNESFTENEVSSKAISSLATHIYKNDVRTQASEEIFSNTEGNPCLPDQYRKINVQVKKATLDRINSKVSYSWSTVHTYIADLSGSRIEVCGE